MQRNLGLSLVLLDIMDGSQRFCQGCSFFDGFDSKRHPLPLVCKGGGTFNALKDLMPQALVFQFVDPNLQYIVTCDASDFAVGVMLCQIYEDGEYPIAFES